MNDISEFKIRLTDTNVDRVEVLKAVRKATMTSQFTMADCNVIALSLLKGERWCPMPMMLASDPREGRLAELCHIDYETLYEEFRRESSERDANIKALIEAGANGDAEAAIALCQGIKDGRFLSYFQPSAG